MSIMQIFKRLMVSGTSSGVIYPTMRPVNSGWLSRKTGDRLNIPRGRRDGKESIFYG
jgi:hypothetical protein